MLRLEIGGISRMELEPKSLDLAEIHKLMMEKMPDEKTRLTFYGTILGAAMNLGEFILKNNDATCLPRYIQYMLMLTYANYKFIFSPETYNMHSADFQHYFDTCSVDQRFAIVVKQLYQICKEEKLL